MSPRRPRVLSTHGPSTRPSRRAFLRGAGVSLALPFLPSMWPREARSQSARPQRLLFWFAPNGIQMDWWTPSLDGEGYDLPDILLPIASVQQHVSVLTGLTQEAAIDDRAGDHARGTGCFLTSTPVRYTAGSDIENGTSVDQVAAQALGGQTLFPSLQLGIEGGDSTGDCDSGYSCAYLRNISWASPSTPLPNLIDPRLVFERLFGGADSSVSAEEAARRTTLRASVLDYVLESSQALSGKLSQGDRLKLDEYMTGLRELEARIQGLGGGDCVPGPEPEFGLPFAETVRAMTDLTIAALQCDLTRIVTFMMGHGSTNRTYDFLGIPEAHHQISHHGDDSYNLSSLVTIDQWEVEQFAYLVQQLATTTDADGVPLIQDTLAFFSSEIEDGDTHAHRNMPVLLAGAGGGAHRSGQHLRYTAEEPIADLYIAMLDAFGVQVPTFGMDGTRPLAGLS